MPQLDGDDRLFQAWANARVWTVDELMDNQALPFEYDQLWSG